MDWTFAIEKHREALKRVLAALVAMAGLGNRQSAIASGQSGSGPTGSDCLLPTADCRLFLPRHLHRAVLRLLRPAEAAARRLIIVAARDIVVPPPPPRSAWSLSPVNGGASAAAVRHAGSSPAKRGVRRTGETSGSPRQGTAEGGGGGAAHQHPTPSLPLFDPSMRFNQRWRPPATGVPRISFPGYTEPFPIPPPPNNFDPVDATRIARRLAAIAGVLDDLPRAARRFALWRARRAAATGLSAPLEGGVRRTGETSGSPRQGGSGETRDGEGDAPPPRIRLPARSGPPRRFHRISPLRPGRPPGRRRRIDERWDAYEVYDVLEGVHGLAVWVMNPADTS